MPVITEKLQKIDFKVIIITKMLILCQRKILSALWLFDRNPSNQISPTKMVQQPRKPMSHITTMKLKINSWHFVFLVMICEKLHKSTYENSQCMLPNMGRWDHNRWVWNI